MCRRQAGDAAADDSDSSRSRRRRERGRERRRDGEGSHEARVELCNDVVDYAPLHIRQSYVAAGEAVGEPSVIEAEQVQQRGVEVVDVKLVLDRLVAVLVGLA